MEKYFNIKASDEASELAHHDEGAAVLPKHFLQQYFNLKVPYYTKRGFNGRCYMDTTFQYTGLYYNDSADQ